MKVLVTGGAGFIGAALSGKLAADGHDVTAIDNINNYYDPRLKYGRLAGNGIQADPEWKTVEATPCTGYDRSPVTVPDMPWNEVFVSETRPSLKFIRLDITDRESLSNLFAKEGFDIVVNLAAQAGVRYSLENPAAYGETNLMGFLNLLECCRQYTVGHFIYASSSSVYGGNTKVPFSETDRVDAPVSLYAATKKSNELMAHTYSHLFGLPTTGLRFFTVYGPWGRPDMAPMLFSDAILEGKPIKVFNHGDMSRDFTYIDDIVEGIKRVAEKGSCAAAGIYNIGRGHAESLTEFIRLLEKELGRKAEKQLLPMQPGDVKATWADTSALERDYGYRPSVSLDEGIARFAAWRKSYNQQLTTNNQQPTTQQPTT